MESLKDLARGCAGVTDIDGSFKGESSQIEDVRKEVMAESLGVRGLGRSLTDKGCQWRDGSEAENRQTEFSIQERRQHTHIHSRHHIRTLPWAQISHQSCIMAKDLA